VKKRVIYIFLLLIGILVSGASSAQELYSIKLDRFKDSGNKELLFEKASKWVQSEKELTLFYSDVTKGIIKAKSEFEYQNKVVLEEAFLTPRIGEKTSGSIQYEINILLTDTSYTIELTNFKHISRSDVAQYNFGVIPKYAEDFNKNCTENPQWCKLVWMDITRTAKIKTRMKLFKANW